MSTLHFDKQVSHLPESRRGDWNGDFVPETIEICPICGDVSCPRHPDDAAALEAERVARDTAAVIGAARFCLDAWDVSENTPPRLRSALSDLSDALAKLERIPF